MEIEPDALSSLEPPLRAASQREPSLLKISLTISTTTRSDSAETERKKDPILGHVLQEGLFLKPDPVFQQVLERAFQQA